MDEPSFASREELLDQVRRHWRLEPAGFQDVRLGRHVATDFMQALSQGDLAPLHAGMSSQALVELLGVPEAVSPVINGVVWFYGSVQLYLVEGALHSLEIAHGVGDFTSLQLTGWFLLISAPRN